MLSWLSLSHLIWQFLLVFYQIFGQCLLFWVHTNHTCHFTIQDALTHGSKDLVYGCEFTQQVHFPYHKFPGLKWRYPNKGAFGWNCHLLTCLRKISFGGHLFLLTFFWRVGKFLWTHNTKDYQIFWTLSWFCLLWVGWKFIYFCGHGDPKYTI